MNKPAVRIAVALALALGWAGTAAAQSVVDDPHYQEVTMGHTVQDIVQSLGQPTAIIRAQPGVVTYVYEGLIDPGNEPAYLFIDIDLDGDVQHYHIEPAE